MGRASTQPLDIPLFLLPAVLFPGAELQLRIFEPRYLSMLSECARQDTDFGICLTLPGVTTGGAPAPAAVGTLARLVDFDHLESGILGIRVRGGSRFRVASVRVRDDGLVRAWAAVWETEPAQPLPAEFGLLATILERLVEQMRSPWGNSPRSCYDDASWVSWRLAELLPLPLLERQQLLEHTDPARRLADLRDLLPRFQPE